MTATPRELYVRFQSHFMGCTNYTVDTPCVEGQKLKDDYEHTANARDRVNGKLGSDPDEYHKGRKKD